MGVRLSSQGLIDVGASAAVSLSEAGLKGITPKWPWLRNETGQLKWDFQGQFIGKGLRNERNVLVGSNLTQRKETEMTVCDLKHGINLILCL